MLRGCILALLLIQLAACSLSTDSRIQVSPLPQGDPQPSSAAPQEPASPAEPNSAAWTPVEPGLAWRELKVGVGNAQILRVDPGLLRVRVGYDAGSPGRVSEWMAAIKPLAVVNGGYFDDQGRATALTVYDGVQAGTSYEGFGGMLAVDLAGVLTIRSLREQPYDSSETLAQALQSTPMLVQDSAVVPLPNDDGARARRTVAALDAEGQLLLIVIGWPTFSLSELGQWLVESKLGVTTALNLDGGSSTGMNVQSATRTINVDSLARVPQVVLIERP